MARLLVNFARSPFGIAKILSSFEAVLDVTIIMVSLTSYPKRNDKVEKLKIRGLPIIFLATLICLKDLKSKQLEIIIGLIQVKVMGNCENVNCTLISSADRNVFSISIYVL